MKLRFKKTIAVILVLIMAVLSASCSEDDGSGVTFKYAFDSDPKNLDPQLSVDVSSLNVIQNLYEGLFKISADGSISAAVASEYSVSSDGLTYNFTLREDCFWIGKNDIKINLTAKDFEFAFQRLINPATKSPYANEYFCIKNAEEINNGELDVDALGVKATDDFKLEIKLDYPNSAFLSLLAKSSSSPCNEEFFYSTKGKYGLETYAVISNGAFYLHQWLYDAYGQDNYLILRKNSLYVGDRIFPYSINYFVNRDTSRTINNFLSGDLDFIIDNGKTASLFKTDKVKYNGYEIASSGIIYNLENPIMQTVEVRKALSLSLDRTAFESELPFSLSASYGIIPSGITVLNKSFRELTAQPVAAPNIALAQYLWESTLTKSEKIELANTAIIVPQSYPYMEFLNFITAQWGENLGFYCSVEPLDDAEFSARVASGNYLLAISQIRGNENSPAAFLDYFKTDGGNFFSLSDSALDEILNSAEKRLNLNESLLDYQLAEKYIIENYYYTPLFYEKEFLIFQSKISDIIYDPFTRQLDFISAKKF